MKVARITHIRCNEHDAGTYVWIPDEWTKEELELAAEKAQQDYLNALKDWENTQEIKYPGYSPNYKDFPDKTVREIEAEFKIKSEKYKLYSDKKKQATQSFGYYLRPYGVKMLWEHDGIDVELDWGHNHSKSFDYKEENPIKDLPGFLKEKEETGYISF